LTNGHNKDPESACTSTSTPTATIWPGKAAICGTLRLSGSSGEWPRSLDRLRLWPNRRLRPTLHFAPVSPTSRSLRSRLAHGMPGRLINTPEDGAWLLRREMPKLKTKSGAKKRFKLTATGKIKAGVAGKRHRLLSHNAKYIRQNRGTKVMSASDAKIIKTFLPYGLS
jgi:large subunit ribosomal protein L35